MLPETEMFPRDHSQSPTAVLSALRSTPALPTSPFYPSREVLIKLGPTLFSKHPWQPRARPTRPEATRPKETRPQMIRAKMIPSGRDPGRRGHRGLGSTRPADG